MTSGARRLSTAADLIARGDEPAEVIGGVIVYKAEPSAEHGDAQLGLGAFLREHFHRGSGGGRPCHRSSRQAPRVRRLGRAVLLAR
jgi:hypothetical protein